DRQIRRTSARDLRGAALLPRHVRRARRHEPRWVAAALRERRHAARIRSPARCRPPRTQASEAPATEVGMTTPPDLLMERLQRAVAPDYRVERTLGGGGMGVVSLAHEALLNRDVAIKVLRPELYTATAAESFLREAQILAGITHPNVIVIFRADSKEGLHFYIMELIKGPTLEDRIAAGPIPVADAVRIGIDLLRGLEAVHRLGLVHRDVK